MFYFLKKKIKKLLPIILESKFFILYSYPLFLGLAIGICFYFSKHFFEVHKINVPFNIFFAGLSFSCWVFAKLFFLWFSASKVQSEIYIKETYFWLGGGFVFYGGLIGALIYLYIYSKITKNFNFDQSYLLIPGGVFAHAVGRLGCFLAGCCYGKKSTLPWSIYLNGAHREPVQLYESAFLILLGLVLIKKINHAKEGWKLILTYLVSYSVFRFFIEFIRGDELRGEVLGIISNSQAVSVFIMFISFIFLTKKMRQEVTQ